MKREVSLSFFFAIQIGRFEALDLRGKARGELFRCLELRDGADAAFAVQQVLERGCPSRRASRARVR